MYNIVILSLAQNYGGAEKSIENITYGLAKKHNVYFFAENEIHIKNLKKINRRNVKIYQLKRSRNLIVILYNLSTIYKIIRRWKIDIILANTNKSALYSGILAKIGFGKIPRFLFIRDFMWIYAKLILKLNYKCKILVPNKIVFEKNEYLLVDSYGILPEIIPGFAFSKIIREQHNSNSEHLIILCLIANISRWKGLIYLLKAFSIALKQNTNIQLIFTGKAVENSKEEKEYFELCQREIKILGIEQYVEHIPFVEDTTKLYEKSDVVVNSSISEFGGPESFGRTIIEAWSYAKPVISFACGGPKYFIENGIDGFLVPEKDCVAMADKILLLAGDRTLCAKMGMEGRKKVEKQYSEKIIVGKLEQLFKEAIENK
jgi:glycosyltransferase involved in cell wall biosynthesis